MELPFSMTVSRVLLFLSADQYFAVPIMHVDGIHPFAGRDVVTVEGRKSLRLGDTPVPLVWLSRLLGLPDVREPGERYLAVLIRQSGKRIALVIDRVEGECEVIVRDLGKYLGKVPLFMGSTILGTGEVALLLDVYDLVTAVRLQRGDVPRGSGGGGTARDRRRHPRRGRFPSRPRDAAADPLLLRLPGGDGVRREGRARAAFPQAIPRRRRRRPDGGGMDGIQLLAEARKSDYTRELPFILVASAEHREDLVRARAAGAKGCVTREEFTPDRMTAMIGSILGRGAGG